MRADPNGSDAHGSPKSIALRGVRVHNLQNIDVDFPLQKLSVTTGLSGSGKSSLLFDTLFAEAQRRYLQSFSAATRQFLDRLEQPDADRIDNVPPAIAVGQRSSARAPRATVGTLTEIIDYLRLLFARAGTVYCLQCGQKVMAATITDVVRAVEEMAADTQFSIGYPSRPQPGESALDWAATLREEGLLRVQIDGRVYRLDGEPLPPSADATRAWVLVDRLQAGRLVGERLTDSLETAFARGAGQLVLLLDNDERIYDQRLICPRCLIPYPSLDARLFSFNDPLGACPSCQGTGVVRSGKRGDEHPCPMCHGTRLGELAGMARIGGHTIAELSSLTMTRLAGLLAEAELPQRDLPAGGLLMEQLRTRLGFVLELELGYLTLDRPAGTLSVGESQRLRLTTALGSNLVNALYVLDEPTIGLHPRDTETLLAVLRRLCDAGNTLVVAEHDAAIIGTADHVVDLGPGAGEEGGRVLYQGAPAGLASCTASLTGAYLSGRSHIAVPARRRPLIHGSVHLVRARTHHLQDLSVEFPLGVLCVVTGVSGAGKSALVQETLYPALCRCLPSARLRGERSGARGLLPETDVRGAGQLGDVVLMDQTPLARTARSNAVTYIKVFDDIRAVFADTTEARVRNFSAGDFSFNQPGGRCETCQGQGTQTVDMQFLADVTLTCPDCQGRRYRRELLNVKVRTLSIDEVLDLTVREAFRFFRTHTSIERRLKWLLDVGLDYLRLGQPADTLSGGECQRLKLAGHLSASRKPRCLFLLDEPAAGLHPADVVRLLDCFDRLLQTGHFLIVVEHNLDVIKCADHVIDLGPGAGAEGGRIVAAGTPEQVAQAQDSHTGRWLRRVLNDGKT
jgi:excinuclease ABC subunit A